MTMYLGDDIARGEASNGWTRGRVGIMTEHSPTPWAVSTWTPSGQQGGVAGILDANGGYVATILAGPDGLSEDDISRAKRIVRAVNCHDAMLAALEAILMPDHAANCMIKKGMTACDCGAPAMARRDGAKAIAQAKGETA